MRTAGLGLLLLLVGGCAFTPESRVVVDGGAERSVERLAVAPGVDVELVHWVPGRGIQGRAVLLLPGLSANARHFELAGAPSLARWLVAQGREVWIVSTRVATVQADGRFGEADFDLLWREDLTRVVTELRRRSGSDLDVVGHSMGGMLLYAYLSQGGAGIHAAVTLGSPTRLDWGGPVRTWIARNGPVLLGAVEGVPLANVTAWFMPLHGRIQNTPVEWLFYNPKLLSPDVWRTLMAVGVSDVPGPLLRQFVRWIGDGRFDTSDGRVDYRAAMARIATPCLVVAGRADRMAPPPSVRDGYRALGGPKRWWVVGEETGAADDYGHMDLILGKRAPDEVWPGVLDFFDHPPG